MWLGLVMLGMRSSIMPTFKLGTPIMGGCSSSLLLLLFKCKLFNPWSMVFKFLLLLDLMLMQVELDDSAKLRRDLPAKRFLEIFFI